MKTSDFINLFKTNGLGKKRQHSGYRVMDGEHCQILVRSTKRRGVPKGSELIGIYFGHDVCLFHKNFYNLRASVTDQVSDPKPVISAAILKESDEYLINSGIIGFDEDKGLLLLEIGETPWLFEQDPMYTMHSQRPPRPYWTWHYNTGAQVSRRVASVAEAENDTALPDDVVSRLGYLLKVMPSNFEPVSTSEADKNILMTPPNPFDYGMTLDDLIVAAGSRVGVGLERGCNPLRITMKVSAEARSAQFKKDVSVYNRATDRFDKKNPSTWEGIHVGDNGTVFIGANEQVYLKGHVVQKSPGTEETDLNTWCQVVGKTSKLRLPIQ